MSRARPPPTSITVSPFTFHATLPGSNSPASPGVPGSGERGNPRRISSMWPDPPTRSGRDANRRDRRKMVEHDGPRLAAVGGAEHLAGFRAEVEPERIAAVVAERLAQDREVRVPLRESVRQRAPRPAAIARLVHANLALWCDAVEVRRERDHERAIRIAGVDHEREPEVARQPSI